VTSTVFYTATTLDGYLADDHDSLDWLFKQDQDENGALSYAPFIENVGAICMGATTYEWVLEHNDGPWPYTQPCWIFTHRDLKPVDNGEIRFAQGDVAPVHAEMAEAAAGKDIWVAGGGGLAADFAQAGLLDRLMLMIAPVTLGSGRPLFPQPFDLHLVDVARNGDFMAATFDVVGPLAESGS
jgi:dihydrofolate reductase